MPFKHKCSTIVEDSWIRVKYLDLTSSPSNFRSMTEVKNRAAHENYC